MCLESKLMLSYNLESFETISLKAVILKAYKWLQKWRAIFRKTGINLKDWKKFKPTRMHFVSPGLAILSYIYEQKWEFDLEEFCRSFS